LETKPDLVSAIFLGREEANVPSIIVMLAFASFVSVEAEGYERKNDLSHP
jgi:hypothetical protein